MGTGITFPISAIPFSILIMVLFFNKERVRNVETKLYKILILTNFVGLILELLCTFASSIYDTNRLISEFIYKSYLVYLLTWTSFFTYYVYSVSNVNASKLSRAKKWLIVLICNIINIIVYILPIEVVIKDNFQTRYTTGLSVTFSYIISAILVLILLIILFKNHKNIRRKK